MVQIIISNGMHSQQCSVVHLGHNAAVGHSFEKTHHPGLCGWGLEDDHERLPDQLMMECRHPQIAQALQGLSPVVAHCILLEQSLGTAHDNVIAGLTTEEADDNMRAVGLQDHAFTNGLAAMLIWNKHAEQISSNP